MISRLSTRRLCVPWRVLVVSAILLLYANTGSASSLYVPTSDDSAQYVALGSSYAAGPGVGYRDVASGRCKRSFANFAQIISRQRNLPLVDVSCSGATTRNILEHGQDGLPPQISAVRKNTRLVTIVAGGNDVAYIPNLISFSCRDIGRPRCPAIMSDREINKRFFAMQKTLYRIVEAVHRRAPGATLVLISYLPVLPESFPSHCSAIPLGKEDFERVKSVYRRLEETISNIAHNEHILFVSGHSVGVGHDSCSAEPYVNGFQPMRGLTWRSPVPYHPNATGMKQLAKDIEYLL